MLKSITQVNQNDKQISKTVKRFFIMQEISHSDVSGVVCSKRLLNQAVGKSLRTHNLKPKKGAQAIIQPLKLSFLKVNFV